MGETPPWRCSAEAVLPRFSAEAWREGLFSPPVFKVISVEQNLKKKKYKIISNKMVAELMAEV